MADRAPARDPPRGCWLHGWPAALAEPSGASLDVSPAHVGEVARVARAATTPVRPVAGSHLGRTP